MLQIKELSFCWILKLCPRATTDSTKKLAWIVASVFLTRWKQVVSCETLWVLEFHFRSPHKLPLPAPPFLPPSPTPPHPPQFLAEAFLFGWGFLIQFTLLRETGLCKTLCLSFPSPQWWLSSAKEVLFLLLSQPLNQISLFNAQMTPEAKVHSQEPSSILGRLQEPFEVESFVCLWLSCLGGF